ncbi:MAG: RIP metalloprotease RseP [Desulfobacterales bacterium]|jgi:regulator of sigma E protease|nr:RIP metalloprotease RseP [Desulfobacterales bacterium]
MRGSSNTGPWGIIFWLKKGPDCNDMTHSVFAFLVVLGILIFFHEFGHFLIARLFGVGVEKFSLGFGPRLIGKKIGITDYRLSLVPLGGYVKMVGEEPDEELDPKLLPLSFTHKSVFKRFLIVFAGPFFNVLLAVLIFFVISWATGILILKPAVGSVKEGSPAFAAGFKKGDLITAIDGVPVDTWEEMADRIGRSNGQTLKIDVARPEGRFELPVTPELIAAKNLLGEDIRRYVIGIGTAGETYSKKLSLIEAASESFRQTYAIVELMVVIVVKLLTGDISIDTVGGPIMIAQMAGDQAKAGVSSLFQFIAVISVNLAVINLLPIPVLDGGHLLFFLIEGIKGRPVNLKVREIAQQVGMVILIMLMILVFYNDIIRLFFSS